MDREALDQATPAKRRMLDQGGTLAVATRRALLDACALKLLRAGN